MGNSESSTTYPSNAREDGAKRKKKIPHEKKIDAVVVQQVMDGRLQSIMQEFNDLKATLDEKTAIQQSAESKDSEDELDNLPFVRRIHTMTRRMIVKDSPIDHDMKKKIPFIGTAIMWFSSRAALLALLTYFTTVSYLADQDTKYLSLDNAAQDTGTSDSNFRTCLSVPFAVTGEWTMDSNGYWKGTSGFQDGLEIYKFKFSNFMKNDAAYKDYMIDVKNHINAISIVSKSASPAINLVIASSWIYSVIDGDYIQSVSLTADPSFIFNRFYKGIVVGNSDYICYDVPDISYDRNSGGILIRYLYGSITKYSTSSATCTSSSYVEGSGYMGGSGTFSYDYSSQSQQPNLPQTATTVVKCPTTHTTGCCPPGDSESSVTSKCVLVPNDAGYSAEYDQKYFSLRYNIRSLVTAFAVNNGILLLTSLSNVASEHENTIIGCYALYGDMCLDDAVALNSTCSESFVGLSYNSTTKRCSIKQAGTAYNIRSFVDLRYSGMDPIYCLIDASKSETATDLTALACTVRVGNIFAYPFLNHMGVSSITDFYHWGYGCYCSKPTFPSKYSSFYDDGTFYMTSPDMSGKSRQSGMSSNYFGKTSTYCNSFDLMHGLVIFKGANYDYHLYLIALMAKLYTAEQVNNMAYYAGFFILRTSGNVGNQDLMTVGGTSKTVLQNKLMSANSTNVFSFCSFATGVTDISGSSTSSCSVLAMQTFDEFDQRVNGNGFGISFSSCNDYISIPETSWDDGNAGGAVNIPPTNLIQDYYECYSSHFNSMMMAFGAASGTAGSLTPIFVTIIAFFVFQLMKPPSKAAKNKENDELIHAQQGIMRWLFKRVDPTSNAVMSAESCAIELKSDPSLLGMNAILEAEKKEQDLDVNQTPQSISNLPLGWNAFTDDSSGDVYYHNSSTGETRWDLPKIK